MTFSPRWLVLVVLASLLVLASSNDDDGGGGGSGSGTSSPTKSPTRAPGGAFNEEDDDEEGSYGANASNVSNTSAPTPAPTPAPGTPPPTPIALTLEQDPDKSAYQAGQLGTLVTLNDVHFMLTPTVVNETTTHEMEWAEGGKSCSGVDAAAAACNQRMYSCELRIEEAQSRAGGVGVAHDLYKNGQLVEKGQIPGSLYNPPLLIPAKANLTYSSNCTEICGVISKAQMWLLMDIVNLKFGVVCSTTSAAGELAQVMLTTESSSYQIKKQAACACQGKQTVCKHREGNCFNNDGIAGDICETVPANSESYTIVTQKLNETTTTTIVAGHGAGPKCSTQWACSAGTYRLCEDYCEPCPKGAVCDEGHVTFETITSEPGYWQLKEYFVDKTKQRCGNSTDEREFTKLKYDKCYETATCRQKLKQLRRGISPNGTLTNNEIVAAMKELQEDKKAACLCIGFSASVNMAGAGCRQGHEGPLCAQCQQGWVLGQDKKLCQPCDEAYKDTTYIGFIFIFIGLVLLIAAAAFFKRHAHRLYVCCANRFETSVQAAGESMDHVKEMLTEALDEMRHKVKLLVGLSQVMSQFNVNFRIPWPIDFSEFISKLQIVNLNFFSVPAVGCYANTNFIGVFLAMSSIPMLLILLLVAVHLLVKYCATKKVKQATKPGDGWCLQWLRDSSHVAFTIVLLLFTIYPGVSNVTLRMFSCKSLQDGSSYLTTDMSIQCTGPGGTSVNKQIPPLNMTYDQYKGFAIFMLIVYPIGVPVCFLICLFRNRKVLWKRGDPKVDIQKSVRCDERAVTSAERESRGALQWVPHDDRVWKSLGVLYGAYEPEYWYWEVVELFRKLLLTGLIIFFYPDSAMQLAIGAMISVTFIAVGTWCQPFADRVDDLLQLVCQIGIFFSYYSGLLLMLEVEEVEDSSYWGTLLIIMVVGPFIFAAVLMITEGIRPLLHLMCKSGNLWCILQANTNRPAGGSRGGGVGMAPAPRKVVL